MSLPGFLLRKLAVAGIVALLILFASRTAAEKTATLAFLKEFAKPIPDLLTAYNAAGDDYCSTDAGKTFLGVTCDADGKVTVEVTKIVDQYKVKSYVYPTLAGTYTRSDVDVVKFDGSAFVGVSGALPSNWPELTQLKEITFGTGTFCGCVPASYKDNTVFDTAVKALTAENQKALTATDCATANACASPSSTNSSPSGSPSSSAANSAGSHNSGTKCTVEHCAECVAENPKQCKNCTKDYVLTAEKVCKEGVLGSASVLFSAAFAAVIGAAVLAF